MELTIKKMSSGYEKEKDIVKSVDLTIKRGEFTCILGANGCGKTTLIKTILGLIPCRKGEVLIGDENILHRTEKERAKKIAYVPQANVTPFPFTVEDVVRMGRTSYLNYLSMERKEDIHTVEIAMKEMGILALRHQNYTQLSGGQKQLVIIARALAQDTPFLIMDEPTSSLDYGNQYRVLKIIKQMCRKKNMGVLMVTHDPSHCFFVSDQVVMMKDGKVEREGPPNEVMSSKTVSKLYQLPMVILEVEIHGKKEKVCIPERGKII